MITKYASLESAELLDVRSTKERSKTASLNRFSEFHDYRTEDGYLYARIRAISSRVNKNHDGWPSVELAGNQELFDKFAKQGDRTSSFTLEASDGADYGFATFLGKPIFVDHHNSDPERARGVIVDAKLHVEDHKTASDLDSYYSSAPDNHMPPTWVELLLEVDAKSFPKLAQAIIDGKNDSKNGIDGFSMGCDIEKSVCSICKNAAHSPDEYCNHVKMKGAEFDFIDKDGRKISKKSYEDCYGIKFFEISAVFDPADETALIRDVVHKEGKVAAEPFDQEQHGDLCPHCFGGGCQDCGFTGYGQPLADADATFAPPEYNPPQQGRVPGPEEQEYEALKFRNQLKDIPTVDPSHPMYHSKTAGRQCPNCGSTNGTHTVNNGYKDIEICENCGVDWPAGQQQEPWDRMNHQPGHPDYQGPPWKGASQKVAQNPLPQDELLHAPEHVDTLRNESICPVCGSSMDEETCEVCGYVAPPEGFDNPDLTKAQEGGELIRGDEPLTEPTPGASPGTKGPTGLAEPGRNNLAASVGVKNDKGTWNVRVHPKVAGRINVVEKPLSPTQESQTDEPKEETVVKDETKPVTSSVRTAKEFIAAAERGKENNMSDKQKVAAEPVPAASPDKRVDVEGVGGVEDASNEQASKADAQVGVDGVGGTGVEGVSAEQEGVNVAQGDEHSKNIEAIHTDTWSGTEGQTSPVQGDTFPSENGQGAGRWSTNIHQAYDSDAFPKDDGGVAGGSATQGTQPADPVGNAQDRVDVLKPVTSPENNSGRTDTWSGTDGNAVTQQQNPVTNETLEGEDIVNLHSSKVFSAIKLADLEVDLGLISAEEKYNRMAELEQKSAEVVEAELAYATKVKTAGLKSSKVARTAGRVPSFRSSSVNASSDEEKQSELDESLFL